MPDSPRYCAVCKAWGDPHTDRHNEDSGKKSTAEVLAELTGDDRTETEAATHQALTVEPCACNQDHDHIKGEQ